MPDHPFSSWAILNKLSEKKKFKSPSLCEAQNKLSEHILSNNVAGCNIEPRASEQVR